jgi:hypothetical protein
MGRDASTAPGRSAIRNPDAEGLPYLPAGHEGALSSRSEPQGHSVVLGLFSCHQPEGADAPSELVP